MDQSQIIDCLHGFLESFRENTYTNTPSALYELKREFITYMDKYGVSANQIYGNKKINEVILSKIRYTRILLNDS